jgi:hypothetical protein
MSDADFMIDAIIRIGHRWAPRRLFRALTPFSSAVFRDEASNVPSRP